MTDAQPVSQQQARRPAHIRDFGTALIATQDLDPVYVAIQRAHLPEPQLCRLLLSYWFFYHLGAAAWLSEQEGPAFWNWVAVAAVNEDGVPQRPPVAGRWPRAAERRHFRGGKSVSAVRWFAGTYPVPEQPVRILKQYQHAAHLMNAVEQWPMFGPWIAFKVADMMERVYGSTLEFRKDICLMYEAPREALAHLVLTDPGGHNEHWWYDRLLEYFSARRAPPTGNRYCGPQEVETILCKWGSHAAGRYQVGKDITEVREALHGWGETAGRLLAAAPPEVAVRLHNVDDVAREVLG